MTGVRGGLLKDRNGQRGDLDPFNVVVVTPALK